MAGSDGTISRSVDIPLRVLLVEDSEPDAELLLEELRRGGYAPMWRRVDTPAALTAALESQPWDVVTCDWVMPEFSAPAALALLREHHVEMPIIIVSGQVGEEFAVTAMKAGAHDFISKDNLARLCPAIERELREGQVRLAHRQAEEELCLNQFSMDQAGDPIFRVDADGRFGYVNDTASRHLGYSREQLLRMHVWDIDPDFPSTRWRGHWAELKAKGAVKFETRHRRRNGTMVPVEISVSYLRHAGREYACSFARDITERRRTDQTLREREARCRAIFEGANDAIFIMDGDAFLECNHMALMMFGCASKVDLVGHHPLEFSPTLQPDGRSSDESAREKIDAALNGTPQRFYWKHRHQDGTPFDAEVSLSRIDLENKAILQGIVRDVTARMQVEKTLRESEERYRSVTENAYDMIAEVGARGEFLYVSPSYKEVLGYDASELLGRRCFEFVHPDDRSMIPAMQIASAANLIVRLRHKSQEWRWFEATRKVFGTADGEQRAVTIARDITERRQAEEALRQSERRFRSLIENSLDLFAIVDGDGKIRYASPSQERVCGFTAEQSVGKDVSEFVHLDDLPMVEQFLTETARHRGCPLSIEYRLRHKDGSWHTVESAGINLLDDPVVAGILIQTRDITERKCTRHALH